MHDNERSINASEWRSISNNPYGIMGMSKGETTASVKIGIAEDLKAHLENLSYSLDLANLKSIPAKEKSMAEDVLERRLLSVWPHNELLLLILA